MYVAIAKALGLYSDVVWQATGVSEVSDIYRQFAAPDRDDLRVVVAPNIPSLAGGSRAAEQRYSKVPGRLRVAFLSRITRKKNLDGALRVLMHVEGEIQFDVYGTLEDSTYWAECVDIIKSLPQNIQVRYLGPIEHTLVSKVLAGYDLFFLPTLGENFGHVILEALAAGCPVLVSDQTAWKDLENKGVGWDLPLGEIERFRVVLRKCVSMGPLEHAELSAAAHSYAASVMRNPEAVDQTRMLFLSAKESLHGLRVAA